MHYVDGRLAITLVLLSLPLLTLEDGNGPMDRLKKDTILFCIYLMYPFLGIYYVLTIQPKIHWV